MIVDALVQGMTHGRAKYDRDARIALSGRTIPELLAQNDARALSAKAAAQDGRARAIRPGLRGAADRLGQQAPRLAGRSGAHRDRVHCPFDRRRFPPLDPAARIEVHELIVAGGGAKNPLMMAQLAASLPGIEIIPSEPLRRADRSQGSVRVRDAWRMRPTTARRTTCLRPPGARHPVVMGKLTLWAARSRMRSRALGAALRVAGALHWPQAALPRYSSADRQRRRP